MMNTFLKYYSPQVKLWEIQTPFSQTIRLRKEDFNQKSQIFDLITSWCCPILGQEIPYFRI
jgi:hypothetical protein